VKNDRGARHDGAQTGHHSRRKRNQRTPASKFDVAKYSEKTAEKEECEPAMLLEFGVMMILFAGGVAALTSAARSQDLLPKKIRLSDLLLLGVATHKLTRIVAKDRITGALRAPFVHYKGSAGGGEVNEEPRGRGFQRAIGELISCPYCRGHGALPRSASACCSRREQQNFSRRFSERSRFLIF
jgi:hypothetical protein